MQFCSFHDCALKLAQQERYRFIICIKVGEFSSNTDYCKNYMPLIYLITCLITMPKQISFFCNSAYSPQGLIQKLTPLQENLFFFFFDLGFTALSRISLISSQSFIKDGQKPENLWKNHLTVHKQNLASPHVTLARLEPQW